MAVKKVAKKAAKKSTWYVYMVCCADDSLYSGITVDVKRRVDEHNTSTKGAKCTRSRRPVELVYKKRCKDRSDAGQQEAALKKLSRLEKLKLVEKR